MGGAGQESGTNDIAQEVVHRLVTEIAMKGGKPSVDDLRQLGEHVAAVGFDPQAMSRGGTRVAGAVWRGQRLTGKEILPNGVAHYLRHRREWPVGTTLDAYVASLRDAARNPGGGIALDDRGGLRLTIVAPVGAPRESDSGVWVIIGYPVNYGYWTTGYRTSQSLEDIFQQLGDGRRWLREPKS